MALIQKIQDMKDDMARWRHALHAMPELAFAETKTSGFLEAELQKMGLAVHKMAGTGLVAVLHGKSGAGGRAIMLRADMDALPVKEDTGVGYCSQHPGAHHACGHDGHMAMLLGAAKYLSENPDFDGTVCFLFQPAEEHLGGAREMINQGLFQKFPCEAVYGLHNFPGLPFGVMATGPGQMLAASDEFNVSFKGTGGHSARPENTTDIVAAAAEAVLSIKEMAAKEIPAGEPAVLTVCALHTEGSAANVLPDTISFNGGLRGFDSALMQKLKDKMEKIIADAAAKHGATADVEWKNGYPVLVNAQKETDFALEVAQDVVGPAVLTPVPRTLGVEDFAFLLQKKPGNFMGLGTGPADGSTAPDLHSAKYDFNDAALPVGASYWARLVEKALPARKPPRPPAP